MTQTSYFEVKWFVHEVFSPADAHAAIHAPVGDTQHYVVVVLAVVLRFEADGKTVDCGQLACQVPVLLFI